MRAHHFTSTHHLPRILESGALRTTESNLHMTIDNAGPRALWLLDGPELGADHGLGGSMVDKTEVMFTVDTEDKWTRRWVDWARAQRIDQEWFSILVNRGGGLEAAERWLISFKPVPSEQWTEIKNTKTGERYEWTK